jgi:hypothetical protein
MEEIRASEGEIFRRYFWTKITNLGIVVLAHELSYEVSFYLPDADTGRICR